MGSGESDGKTVGEGVGVSNEGSVEDAGGKIRLAIKMA